MVPLVHASPRAAEKLRTQSIWLAFAAPLLLCYWYCGQETTVGLVKALCLAFTLGDAPICFSLCTFALSYAEAPKAGGRPDLLPALAAVHVALLTPLYSWVCCSQRIWMPRHRLTSVDFCEQRSDAGLRWNVILMVTATCILRLAVVFSVWLHEAAHLITAALLGTRDVITCANITGTIIQGLVI